jgi:hypothetical protein
MDREGGREGAGAEGGTGTGDAELGREMVAYDDEEEAGE